ncbi:MAG: tetratricopeptide repeat protein, partial [Acidobacteria bacterium]|nr:tetratricopeptide repeat protein [Acidobacteriota bacterium]
MAAENPRITELRRRVQSDPSAVAFAQLAEECRRAGDNDEAVRLCRAGLQHHPGYLSARVTLGRAMMATGQLEDAELEFDLVLLTAPDNLAAIRGMAEISQRRGNLELALGHYETAFRLARHDSDLEQTIAKITRALADAADANAPGLPVEPPQTR